MQRGNFSAAPLVVSASGVFLMNNYSTDQMPTLDEMRRTAAKMRMAQCQHNLDLLALKEMPPCPTCGKRVGVRLPRTIVICRHFWQSLKTHSSVSFSPVQTLDSLVGLSVEFHEDA